MLNTAMTYLLMGLAAIFVLTFVMFVHELGHYLAARYYGVKVAVFSFFIGPELYHRIDKNGTRWRVALVPIAAYVKFGDDANAASFADPEALARMTPEERAGALQTKTPWQRAVILIAGPAANFLLALILFTFVFKFSGERILAPRISEVVQGSVAEAAGFKAGDLVLSVNGEEIAGFDDLRRLTLTSAGSALAFVVDRGGKTITLDAIPRVTEFRDGFGGKTSGRQLGIRGSNLPSDLISKEYTLIGAVGRSAAECYRLTTNSLQYIWQIVTRRASADQLGGPTRIAVASSKVVELGLTPMIFWMGIVSVGIGVLNLFIPIPILDAFGILMCAVEGIRGYPLGQKTQEYAYTVGFVLVLSLILLTTFNDISWVLSLWG